ncbi:hypothetical protein CGRA01v4_08622 [Colletotrichum graminicola]|nr:hypothetical protein CGRA01v4_08622 [Colletotrichum graminicola]
MEYFFPSDAVPRSSGAAPATTSLRRGRTVKP